MLIPGALYKYQNEIYQRNWYFNLKNGRLTWYYQIVPVNIGGNILVTKGDTIMFLKQDDIGVGPRFSFLFSENILNLAATLEDFSNAWVRLT